MKRFLKLLSTFLCLALLVGGLSPAFSINAKAASIMQLKEKHLLKEETFIVTKEANAKSVPYSKHGSTVMRLHVGDVITSDTYVENKYGNAWQLFSTPDGRSGYFYTGNLELHSEHTYLSLGEMGFPFKFCSVCGHLQTTQDLYAVPLDSGNEDYTKIHLALTLLSLCPGIGTAADVTEGLLYLKEGNTQEALLAFASIIPCAEALEMLKYTDEFALIMNKGGKFILKNADDVADSASDVAGAMFSKGKDGLKATSTSNRYYLKKNMAIRFEKTGELRYFKNLDDPKYSWAAHHIVSLDDPRAAYAASILSNNNIDLNDARNGLYLPMRSGLSEATLHRGKHSDEYYETINHYLTRCNSPEEVEDALDKIAELLLRGDLSL